MYRIYGEPFCHYEHDIPQYYIQTEEFVERNRYKEKNYKFNQAIYELFPENKCLKILDLGCGSGTPIEDFVNDGHYMALGVDCFFVYKKYLCGPWKTMPNNFMMLDFSKPFTICWHEYGIHNIDNPVIFDVIYSSEAIEHIFENRVDTMCQNIVKHMDEKTLFVAGISERSQSGHLTVHNRGWWIDKFKEFGLEDNVSLQDHFKNRYVRILDDSHYFTMRKSRAN